jgi:hypothetical protein
LAEDRARSLGSGEETVPHLGIFDLWLEAASRSESGPILSAYLVWWRDGLEKPTESRRVRDLPGRHSAEVVTLKRALGVKPRECWRNATQLALAMRGCEFVEGLVYHAGLPIHHAWNRVAGIDFDITLELAEVESRVKPEVALPGVDARLAIPSLNAAEVSQALDAVLRSMGELASWRHLSPVTSMRTHGLLGDEKAWRALHYFPLN